MGIQGCKKWPFWAKKSDLGLIIDCNNNDNNSSHDKTTVIFKSNMILILNNK